MSDAVKPEISKNSGRRQQETNNKNSKHQRTVESRGVSVKSRNPKQGGNREKSDAANNSKEKI